MAFVNPDFWQKKRVFLTGHTGFKGSWLSLWLQSMGASVKGFAFTPPTDPALFTIAKVADDIESEIGDIRDLKAISSSMKQFEPHILIHMAAQPLVGHSYRNPVETYTINVMGTVHVLEAARQCSSLTSIVNVTSDKCYENLGDGMNLSEHDSLGGHDPYSNSKGCSELATSAYRHSFFYKPDSAALASARAGNAIGGGDWADQRLIPDILRAFDKKQPVVIRDPHSTRPWQHVLEPLSGYLILAQHLDEQGEDFAQGWNFGPDDKELKPVEWIINSMVEKWGNGVSWELEESSRFHEARSLNLDISKARSQLNWQPTWDLETSLNRTIVWHQAWSAGEDMQKHCLKEIHDFMAEMKKIQGSNINVI